MQVNHLSANALKRATGVPKSFFLDVDMTVESEIAAIEAEIFKIKQTDPLERREIDSKNRLLRSLRVKAANLRGTHTKDEWHALIVEFDSTCVRCSQRGLVVKDHIIPLYQGGSNHISNLQPLCARCNTSKGPESKNWVIVRRSARNV